NRALRTVESISELGKRADALARMAGHLHRPEWRQRATVLLDVITKTMEEADAPEALAYAQVAYGNVEQAISGCRSQLHRAHLLGQDAVFGAITVTASVLASAGLRAQLTQIYQEWMAIESWWGASDTTEEELEKHYAQ